jgi:hypothetical protein
MGGPGKFKQTMEIYCDSPDFVDYLDGNTWILFRLYSRLCIKPGGRGIIPLAAGATFAALALFVLFTTLFFQLFTLRDG